MADDTSDAPSSEPEPEPAATRPTPAPPSAPRPHVRCRAARELPGTPATANLSLPAGCSCTRKRIRSASANTPPQRKRAALSSAAGASSPLLDTDMSEPAEPPVAQLTKITDFFRTSRGADPFARAAAHARRVVIPPVDPRAAERAEHLRVCEHARSIGRACCPCRPPAPGATVPPGGTRCPQAAATPGYVMAADGTSVDMVRHLNVKHLNELWRGAPPLPGIRATLHECSRAEGTVTLGICTRCEGRPPPGRANHAAIRATPEDRRHHHVAPLVVFDADDRLFGGCAAHVPRADDAGAHADNDD